MKLSGIVKLTALVLSIFMLTGCAAAFDYPDELPKSTTVPPSPPSLEEPVDEFEAELFFVSEDGRILSPETRTVSRFAGQNRAEAALLQLEQGPESPSLILGVPKGLSLDHVELSPDAANVYYKGIIYPYIKDWLILRACVASTVSAVEGIQSVNVYFDSMEPGYAGRALGALSPIEGALDVYLDNLKQEYEVLTVPMDTVSVTARLQGNTYTLSGAKPNSVLKFTPDTVPQGPCFVSVDAVPYLINGTLIEEKPVLLFINEGQAKVVAEPPLKAGTEASSYESRVVTLYFLDTAGQMLLGSNRPLYYDRRADSVTIVKELLRELITGPKVNGLEPVLPADLTLAEDPIIEYISPPVNGVPVDEGLCDVNLIFKMPSQGFEEHLVCGAIVLTLTGYLPEVKSVRISFMDESGTIQSDSLHRYYRDDFQGLLGQLITVAFPDPDGSALYRVNRAVPQNAVYDAGARLRELFRGPADPGVLYPVFTQNDVKDVYIAGDTAVIDWKEGFSAKLSELMETGGSLPKERREQLFIFSVINTITEIPGISHVLMLEDMKEPVTKGRIYLGNPLLRNPKLYIEG